MFQLSLEQRLLPRRQRRPFDLGEQGWEEVRAGKCCDCKVVRPVSCIPHRSESCPGALGVPSWSIPACTSSWPTTSRTSCTVLYTSSLTLSCAGGSWRRRESQLTVMVSDYFSTRVIVVQKLAWWYCHPYTLYTIYLFSYVYQNIINFNSNN